MATAIQFRRGTTAQHANFTGLVGEITVDTDLDTLRVHDGSTAGGTRLAKYSEISALGTGDITNVIAGSGLSGGAESGNATLAIDYENLSGNLVPSANNTYSLGSLSYVWKDVYVGPGSLYVNGQKVLEDNAGTIQVSADANQNLSLLTTGSGDIELTAGNEIQLKSNVVLSAGKSITASGGLKLTSNLNVNSNYINNVGDPVAAQDAATKAYVDGGTYITVTDAGGDGSLTQSGATITYTGPSASEVRAHFSAGDGIGISTGSIAVDNTVVRTTGTQTIGGAKTFSDDIVLSGNLTVSGTQTIVNSSVTSLADSILELNRDASGAPSEDAGLTVNRGSSADVQLIWDESEDKWAFTNDGSTYQNMLTDSSARALVSATDAGGDGSFSYNSSTGAFTYTGPSAAEVRAHFSAGTGITITSGTIATTITQYADGDARAAISVTDSGGDGALSYNAATGVITYTGPSASEVRAHFSAGTGITIASGVISTTITQYTNSDVDSHLNTGTATTGQLMSWDGSDYDWIDTPATYGDSDARSAISVTDSGGDGALSYNSSTGVITYTGPSAAEVRAHFTGGTGITISSGTISTNDGAIVHDSLSGFVANEHIDHSSVTITAGSGLTGGGNITATRTLNVGAGNGITVNADDVAVNVSYYDTDEGGTGWAGNLSPSSNNVYSLGSATNVWKTAYAGTSIVLGGTALTRNAGQLSWGGANVLFTGDATSQTTIRSLFSATDAGGDGSFSYSNGVFTYTGPSQAEANTRIQAHVSGGTGITFSAGGVIATNDSQIVHDSLSGFVANEHINHSSVSILAGSYLTGGGTIVASRTLNVDATTTATANKVAARDASGDLYANIFQGTATSARYADVAEKYATDAEYEPGTVVIFGGTKEVTACFMECDHRVAGVVSTDPAYMMNSEAEGQYIALTGRVPCKVTGVVEPGDLLVTHENGRAIANNGSGNSGRIIGKAIGRSAGGDSVIEVLVNLM